MPSPQETAKNIKKQCQSRGITAKQLLEECELGVNTLGKMSKGNDAFLTRIAHEIAHKKLPSEE